MAFQDLLREATYQSVPFGVLVDSETAGGRRLVEHELPGTTNIRADDTGGRPISFQLEGWIVGQGEDGDYFDARQDLIDALQDPAGGTLVHPYWGTQRVNVRRWRVRESARALRVARITVEFVRSGEAVSPLPLRASPAQADFAAMAISDASADVALEDLVLEGPGVIESVREAASSAISAVGAAIAQLDVFSGIAAEAQALGGQVTSLIDDASQLATAPLAVVASVQGAVDGIIDSARNFASALDAYEQLFGLSPDPLTGSPIPIGALQDGARTAITDLALRQAAAGAVRAAARVDWESLDQAEEARVRLGDQLDTLMATAPASVVSAMQAALLALSETVPPSNVQLPRVATFTPRVSIPDMLVAYRLYGDAGRAPEIQARNGLVRPAFAPGGTPLEVLSS